jgi:hypothetical protein
LLYRGPSPPASEGRVIVDDLALIAWEEQAGLDQAVTFDTPHARDFLRVKGPAGDYCLTLTFQA